MAMSWMSAIEKLLLCATLGASAGGLGLVALRQEDPPQRASLAVRGSLVERNHQVNILVQSSDATIASTVVRDARPNALDWFGDGIIVQATDDAATAQVTASDLRSNARAGLLFAASSGSVEAVVSTGNRFGLVLSSSPDVLVARSAIFDNIEENNIDEAPALNLPRLPPPIP